MEYYMEMKGVTKRFHGVTALEGVQLSVRPGEVHALVGENGAGKSTLMKILDGLCTADAGEIRIQGRLVRIKSPTEARHYGINFMHQEICLAGNLSIAENLFLGMECCRLQMLDKSLMLRLTQEHLDLLELELRAGRFRCCTAAASAGKMPQT